MACYLWALFGNGRECEHATADLAELAGFVSGYLRRPPSAGEQFLAAVAEAQRMAAWLAQGATQGVNLHFLSKPISHQ